MVTDESQPHNHILIRSKSLRKIFMDTMQTTSHDHSCYTDWIFDIDWTTKHASKVTRKDRIRNNSADNLDK